MLALRYLQADDCLTKEEPPVPRADRKKKTARIVGKQTTSHEMMHYWSKFERGQLSLKHEIPIPQKDIYTVRAVPQVINSLLNKVDPSLRELAKWTNQYYEASNLNI